MVLQLTHLYSVTAVPECTQQCFPTDSNGSERGSSCSSMDLSVLCPAVQCTVCEAREGKQQQQIGKKGFQLHFFHTFLQLAGHEKFSAVFSSCETGSHS